MPGKDDTERGRWRGSSRRAVRFVEPTLLLLLRYGPSHGYPLVEQLGGYGLADVDPSIVYRALRDMEKRDWVISSWDKQQTKGPPRRVYQLTALGEEVLGWWMQDLRDTRDMIDHLLGAYGQHVDEVEGERLAR